MGPACTNCRFKCRNKVTCQDRTILFEEYWKLGDRYTRQWDNLDKLIEENRNPEETTTESTSRHFFLKFPTGKIKVCRTMFLNTFGKFLKLYFYNISGLGSILTSKKVALVDKNRKKSFI